jgi:peptidoglycan hydrolase-like protein with peptidoglycan-binding domain
MALNSHLFRGDGALEACLAQNSAHITSGARGSHVTKIQSALIDLDEAVIDQDELGRKIYGPSTAAAVLAYKQKRSIINRSYQSSADDIVGKMTIKAMDDELVAKQEPVRMRIRTRCERVDVRRTRV